MAKHTFAVTFLLALATSLSAQQLTAERPVISGVVVDAVSGANLSNAEVRLVSTAQLRNSTHTSHNVLATARTDEEGQFSFSSLITRPARVDFPFETSVTIDFAVQKDRQVLNVRRVEVISSGPKTMLPNYGLSPAATAEVKIYVAAPESAGR